MAAFALLSLLSCEKEKQDDYTIEHTFDKTLKVNESATFTLPANTSDDAFQITTEASHASVSMLGEDLDGNSIYSYTPEKDYTGTDLVIVSTIEDNYHGKHPNPHHSGKSKGGHNCNGGKNGEQQIIVIINLSILKEKVTGINYTKAGNAIN